jgi:hypothetical protein
VNVDPSAGLRLHLGLCAAAFLVRQAQGDAQCVRYRPGIASGQVTPPLELVSEAC